MSDTEQAEKCESVVSSLRSVLDSLVIGKSRHDHIWASGQIWAHAPRSKFQIRCDHSIYLMMTKVFVLLLLPVALTNLTRPSFHSGERAWRDCLEEECFQLAEQCNEHNRVLGNPLFRGESEVTALLARREMLGKRSQELAEDITTKKLEVLGT